MGGVCGTDVLIRHHVCVHICFFQGEVRDSNRTGDTCHFSFLDARGYLAWLVELEVQSHRWDVIPVD